MAESSTIKCVSGIGPVRLSGREIAAMSTVPAKQPPATEGIEEKFRRLAAAWLAGTAYVSSSSDLVAHPAFQEIVGMGPAVIPLVLRELQNRTGHWHRALRRITGADPVPPAVALGGSGAEAPRASASGGSLRGGGRGGGLLQTGAIQLGPGVGQNWYRWMGDGQWGFQ
jgi:hypothetical protein